MKLLEINNKILLEAKLYQLETKTRQQTPKLADRADFVESRYLGISKFGIFNFRTSSQSHPGNAWYQTIEVKDMATLFEEGEEITARDIQNMFHNQDIRLMCDDPSFLYWSFKYMAHTRDYGLEPETRAPQVNNVRLKGALCKHLLSVVDLIKSGQLFEQMAKDVTNWLAYNKGDSYKSFNRGRLIHQAKTKKDKISWETADSYMNDFMASKAGFNKFLDDEDIKGSLAQEIDRINKSDPNMTLDEFIEEEFGENGVEGLAKELEIDQDYIKEYFKKLGWVE